MYNYTAAEAVTANDLALEAQHAVAVHVGVYDPTRGNDNTVVRPDLGFIIFYASTATHAFEARANGTGGYFFRINHNTYSSADEIPSLFRKFLPIAREIEASDDLTRTALSTRWTADQTRTAANEYRDPSSRSAAQAALAGPNPFA